MKACYNELVASRLGQLIGAPILRGGIVYVPDEIIPVDHRTDGATPGFHFGLTRMEGENFVPAHHYAEIENASELPFAAVHLAWLAVGDQQGHNQYLQRLEIRREGYPPVMTKRFKLIDMGQMFGDCAWTAGSVNPVHTAYVLPNHLAAKLTFQKLAPAIQAVSNVAVEAIRECFADCPDDWNISAEDRRAGAERAIAAAAQVEQIIRSGNPAVQ